MYETASAPYRPRYLSRSMSWRVGRVASCSSMAIGRDRYVIAFTMEPGRRDRLRSRVCSDWHRILTGTCARVVRWCPSRRRWKRSKCASVRGTGAKRGAPDRSREKKFLLLSRPPINTTSRSREARPATSTAVLRVGICFPYRPPGGNQVDGCQRDWRPIQREKEASRDAQTPHRPGACI